MTLPTITIEKLERGPDYETPYRAHIVGPDFDHHGEADTPEMALLYAATRWHVHELNRESSAAKPGLSLTDAVRKARGGQAPTPKQGFA